MIACACLLSGFTFKADTGKGFLLVTLPLVVIVAVLHLARHASYRSVWVVGSLGFLVISIANGSRPGSIFLIASAMVLMEALRVASERETFDWRDERILLAVLLFFIALAGLDLAIFAKQLDQWSSTGKFISLPRLKFLFSEPSHLGPFLVATLFLARGWVLRGLLAVCLVLTQSYYAFAYFGLLAFRRQMLLLAAGAVVVAGGLYLQAQEQVDFFFQNSGLVRLVGLSLLESFTTQDVLFGKGLGSGDEALKDVFLAQGIEDASSGFLFSLIYDMGLVGVICVYLAFVRRPFDAVRLTFLLLNFGAGSFLVPVLMILAPRDEKKHESRFRLRLASLQRARAGG